jgi:hypothetical protein
MHGKMTNVYTILVSKLEGIRLLGRPKHRDEVNIEMDLK